MREQSPNHSDPIPNAENWILVSDPFERPKVYRHRLPVLKTEHSSGHACGVYIFVMNYPGEHPIILHDIESLVRADSVARDNKPPRVLRLCDVNDPSSDDSASGGRYAPPTLRLIINDSPVEIGNAHPYITEGKEGFLQLPNRAGFNARVIDLNVLRDLRNETPFRLKIENNQSSQRQEHNTPTFRGVLDADGTLALRQAIALYDFFRGTP